MSHKSIHAVRYSVHISGDVVPRFPIDASHCEKVCIDTGHIRVSTPPTLCKLSDRGDCEVLLNDVVVALVLGE